MDLFYFTIRRGIIFFILVTGISYPQWTPINILPENIRLNSIFFLDDNNGWICGENGIILKYDTDSLKWDRIFTDENFYLNSISFYNTSVGLAAGNNGLILKSSDSGVNWETVVSDTTYDLKSIYIKNNIAFAVGSNGIILKSTDIGSNWTDISFENSNYNSVFFLDEYRGYIGADTGYILKTTNSGQSWSKQQAVPGEFLNNIYSVFFVDSSNGFIGGGDQFAQMDGFFSKTTDGGDSWDQTSMNGTVLSLDFTDVDNGIISGGSGTYFRFLSYYNSGIITQKIWHSENYDITSCTITPSGRGWAAGWGGSLFYADDYKDRWDQIYIGTNNFINDIKISSDNDFYIGGTRFDFRTSSPIIMKGSDNSLLFKDILPIHDLFSLGGETIRSLEAADSLLILGHGDFHQLKTTDGGAEWFQEFLPFDGSDNLFFINDDTGWCQMPDIIAMTTDFGGTWTEQFFNTSFPLTDIFMVNGSTGYLSGFKDVNQGRVLKTTNGGADWFELPVPAVNPLTCLHFFDENNGYAAGAGAALIKTMDGGLTWSLLSNNPVNVEIKVLEEFDRRKRDRASFIFFDKSINKYKQIRFLNDDNYTDMDFDRNIGFISSTQGRVYKSINYGLTWTPLQIASVSENIYRIKVDKINKAVAVSDINMYLYNYDTDLPVELIAFTAEYIKGKVLLNWKTETEKNNKGFEIQRLKSKDWEVLGFADGKGTTTEKQEYTFADENLSPGNYKYRLKQIDYDGTFEYSQEIEVSIALPYEFSLSQNYPNPFNPTTKIKYAIPEHGNVILKIFDILGNEVLVLENKEQEAGEYEVNFDAGNLASGIYFYQIKTGKFISTKKMTVVH